MYSIPPMIGAIRQLRSHSNVSLPTEMNPQSRSPSRFSSGTSHSSNESSAVTEVRFPIFARSLPTDNPGESRSTMNAEMPLLPAARLVEANTMNTLAIGALVMNILEPLRTHRPDRSSAVVLKAAASEPDDGSVSPKAPTLSADASFGRYLCLGYSVQRSKMGTPHRIV